MNKKIFITVLTCVVILFGFQSCDKDEFAELNSNPSTVSDPDIRFLISKSLQQIYQNDYTIWFYTYNDYVFPYTQALSSTSGGNLSTFNTGGENIGLHGIMNTINPGIDARIRIDALEEEDKQANQAMKAVTYATQIYIGLVNIDYNGGMAYSEAGLAPYTDPALLTPKIDNEEELLNTWLLELDDAIAALQLDNQFSLGNQDIIYNGDYTKWAKFCNLLKLRIAARLINQNRTKALEIASEVANSVYMDDIEDDLLFNEGVEYYGTGNGVGGGWVGYAGKNLIEFLKDVRDPRLRFIFRKNEMSPEVIDAIIATNGVEGLPSQIRSIVNLGADNMFESWKEGFEEPWGRYWGVPLSTDSTTNKEYFQQSTQFFATNAEGAGKKTYEWTSYYEEKNQRTAFTFTYPTKPSGEVHELLGREAPLYVLLGSAAETNLYLAEFKLLGASLPETAQDYLNKGVAFSVARMDDLAKRHQNPYYEEDPVLDNPAEGATKLKADETDNLLAAEALTLNGTDDLEKVYIQQYINNLLTPGDLWTTVRRSGIPKKGSAYFAWEEFGVDNIPRRVVINTPDLSSLMYENLTSYYQSAGFTTSDNTPAVLNSERLWFDKNNPNYGAGPNN